MGKDNGKTEGSKVACANGKAITDWLERAKISLPDHHVSRVIIDMKVGLPVKVYVTQFGDEKMFDVAPPDLSEAEIVEQGGATDTSDVCDTTTIPDTVRSSVKVG